MQLLTQKDLDALAKANATSVEGVDHARTIKAHGTEQFEVHRYETDLNVSYDICILKVHQLLLISCCTLAVAH